VLDAASDLKTTAPASPDAEHEPACKCELTAQDTPIWLPAVRPPPGRAGREGDAPVADAFRGEEEEGGLRQGQAQAHTCRRAHAAQRRVAGTGTIARQTETSGRGPASFALGGCSGAVGPAPGAARATEDPSPEPGEPR